MTDAVQSYVHGKMAVNYRDIFGAFSDEVTARLQGIQALKARLSIRKAQSARSKLLSTLRDHQLAKDRCEKDKAVMAAEEKEYAEKLNKIKAAHATEEKEYAEKEAQRKKDCDENQTELGECCRSGSF